MENTLKNTIMNYVGFTLEEIIDNRELECKPIILKDLITLQNYIRNTVTFIKVKECENGDIISIYPETDEEPLKVLYTEELENKDPKYISFKFFSELFIYLNGYYNIKGINNITNNCYLFLYHLYILPDVQIRYGVSLRNGIYNKLKEKNPEFLLKYKINISEKKLNYYFQLSFNKNLNMPILKENICTFNNGNITNILYNKIRISQGEGIKYFTEYKTFYNNNYKFNYFIPRDNTYTAYQITYLDNNNNLIKDKKLIKDIKNQYKIINKLSA